MKFIANLDGVEHQVNLEPVEDQDNQYVITLDGHAYRVDAHSMLSEIVTTIIDGKSYDIDIEQQNLADSLDGRLGVRVRGRVVYLEMLDERHKKMKDAQAVRFSEQGLIRVCSPMPGKVLRVMVKEGEVVEEGQGLLVVEAMKMENELKAAKKGVIKELLAKPGAPVEGGALLLTIE